MEKIERHFIVVIEFGIDNKHRITRDCYDDLKKAIELCDHLYKEYSKVYNITSARVDYTVYFSL